MKKTNRFCYAKIEIDKRRDGKKLSKILLKKMRDFGRSITEDFDRQIFGNKQEE